VIYDYCDTMMMRIVQKDRKGNRLKGFDYSRDNEYFITICVQDHDECFGVISDGKMELNEFGKIANNQFDWLQNQYPYVTIPVWIIMPDHVHAIIEINRGTGRSRPSPDARTGRDLSLTAKIKPLPELIGAYKTTTSKKLHQSGFIDFRWQRSYHDHIIRNLTEYNRIINYIQNNPQNLVENNLHNKTNNGL
jgi:putative transposase